MTLAKLDGYTTFGVLGYSVGLHLAAVLAAMWLGRVPPAEAFVPPPPSELTFVELAPSSPGAGDSAAAGERGARGHAPSRARAAAPSQPAAPAQPPVVDSPRGAAPVASAAPAARVDMAEAVRRAMLAPASSGAPGAGGDGGAGLGSYKAVLAGWLQARVAGGGGAAEAPHEARRVTARVTISQERAITG
ncbi:MAG: hypothetical protein IT374_08130 [Polyangiaceae bacterium]|nr:hypothetical protein [Polyangiaceae bacterium]